MMFQTMPVACAMPTSSRGLAVAASAACTALFVQQQESQTGVLRGVPMSLLRFTKHSMRRTSGE